MSRGGFEVVVALLVATEACTFGCGGDDAAIADAGGVDSAHDSTIDAATDAGGFDVYVSDAASPDAPSDDASAPDDADAGCQVTCTAVAPSTAQCIDGRCLVTLATGQNTALGIAVDATYVYFVEEGFGGSVKRVPINGGPVGVLATTFYGGLSGIAINATTIFFTAPVYGTLSSVPIGGGTATVVVDENADQGRPTELAIDGQNLYWSVALYGPPTIDNGFWKLPLVDGGVPSMIAPGLGVGYWQIAIDANKIYWGGDVDGGVVFGAALDGGGATALTWSPPGSYVMSVAVDSTSLYYTWEDSVTDGGIGGVSRAPLGGGPSTAIASSGPAYALAVDSPQVYWTQAGGPTALNTAPVDGGAALVLSTTYAQHITVDSTSIYWTTGNAVMKLTPR